MEQEDYSIFYECVVERKKVNYNVVYLHVRRCRSGFRLSRGCSHIVRFVSISDDDEALCQFAAARKLRVGDKVQIEAYDRELRQPKYCNLLQRYWNLLLG